MTFTFGQVIFGIILVGIGVIIATEVNKNNFSVTAPTPTAVQNVATSTPAPAVATPSFINNSGSSGTGSLDSIINCNFPHTGTLRVTQSKCDAMTDCEISPGKWQTVFKTDCDALHKSQSASNSSTNTQDTTGTSSGKKVQFTTTEAIIISSLDWPSGTGWYFI